jgi:hypothetical protein
MDQLTSLLGELLKTQFADQSVTEALLPGSGVWVLSLGRSLSTVTAVASPNGRPQVAVTTGVAKNVPKTDNVLSWINGENRQTTFGRVFYQEEEGDAITVLFQDYAPADDVTWDNMPTVQNLFTVLEWVIGRGNLCADSVLGEFGGTPFTEEDAMLLSMLSS